jgi:16S rRNA (guanine966-N2)-methyltransferase
VRVIGGTARGRRITAPRLPELRPTSDRVREAIFDVLASLDAVEGADVLDLFAGSGALGIEALSRGAASVTFVESERAAVAAIEANLVALGFAAHRPGAFGLTRAGSGPSSVTVVRADAVAWCASAQRRYDLALCDPTYRFDAWPALLEHLPADLAVLESSRPVQLSGGLVSRRSYRYGTTLVTVVAQGDALPEASS